MQKFRLPNNKVDFVINEGLLESYVFDDIIKKAVTGYGTILFPDPKNPWLNVVSNNMTYYRINTVYSASMMERFAFIEPNSAEYLAIPTHVIPELYSEPHKSYGIMHVNISTMSVSVVKKPKNRVASLDITSFFDIIKNANDIIWKTRLEMVELTGLEPVPSKRNTKNS